MHIKPNRCCLVAKVLADGWVCLTDCLPFEQAVARRQDDARYVVLRDAAIAEYEAARRPRRRGPMCNGD